ncbi:TA system antitoxin ParD family protein [Microbulbifer sp. 2201CG32-9]|uniref:TA system antitoxin ParD family protein n=1 Tax=Microbulbifer sp. 2201CG32-9 TaxID=3232309 RepID=UPI00345B621C
MAQTIKLSDDELLNAAKDQKDHYSRSLNGQIEHWARIGRFVEESGIFDLHKVNLAFQGKIPVEDLTGEEEHAHARMLWNHLENLGGHDERIARRLEKAGAPAYELDDQGKVQKVKTGRRR